MLKTTLPIVGGLILLAAAPTLSADSPPPLPDEKALQTMNARFAPVDLTVDVSALPPNEQQALVKMVEAARIMDGLFLRQVSPRNTDTLLELSADTSSLGRSRLDYFLMNKGPWSRLDHFAPFVPGAGVKPPQGNFYPADVKKDEVEAWFVTLPEAERAEAKGFFTTIRKTPAGKLTAVPFSVEYQGELVLAAARLREAAALTTQPSLKRYLETRAAAFLSNDYYASDLAWMELDASVEPTIGPYETYEDEWFGFKAGFEAFITLRDDAETAKLAKFGQHLQSIEDNLPIEAKYRNPKLGALSPIRVVNQLYASGDGRRGVATAAFNLPNDERVTREKGAKRVMLKNVQEQKFNNVLLPISKAALSAADQKNVAFDVFFTHILMHELMHGLGPHEIKSKKSTPRAELKDLYGAIEEAKADISGLFAMQFLVDKGVLPKSMEQTMYTTFLASSFRTIRFGINEAHGKGQAMQLNWLLDKGAFKVAKDGTFSVDAKKAKEAVKGLTRELMTVEAEGNYARAQELLKTYAVIRPQTQKILDALKSVPVDIWPRFVTADKLLAASGQ